jgi:hypothetical protein
LIKLDPKISSREELLPRLNKVPNRFIITYGDASEKDDRTEKSLAEQVNMYNSKEISSKMFIRYKPLADIHSLGRQTNLYKLWRETRKENAEKIKNTPEEKSSHSAEGIVLDIAEILCERAKKILRDEKCIQDLIHAALLAVEAKELLGGKTATISLEMLDVQHQAELLAECRCCGTDYNKRTILHRIAEIRKEVYLICQWYRPASRRLAGLSARSKIVGGLTKILEDARQIEEYDLALIETRRLSGLLFVHHNRWALPFYPFRWYFEYLQRSLKHFAFVILLWFILFVILWSWNFNHRLSESVHEVFDLFWKRGTPAISGRSTFLTQFLGVFPYIIGITHILVLISNLHARIQRK